MAAAPPPGRRCPCTACSSRESPRGAPRQDQQAASGCPIGKVLPRSQRRAGKDSGSYAQCRRPSQRPRRGYPFRIPTAPPLALAAPAPHPRTTAAAAAGRAFPLGRLLRPGHHAGRARTRSAARPLPSLHDPRHRSCTGSQLLAALPSHAALRQRSGLAAAADSGQGVRAGKNSARSAAAFLRITLHNYAQKIFAHNSRYTHNRASGPAAGHGQGLRAVAGSCMLRPSAERPAAAARCAAARAGLRAVVGSISARCCCTLLQQPGPGKAGRPPSRAPAPAHPAQRKQRQSRACRPVFACCCSIEKAPPGDKTGRAFLLPTATTSINGRPKNKHTGGNVWLLSGFTSATHGLKPGRIHATVTIPIIVRTD